MSNTTFLTVPVNAKGFLVLVGAVRDTAVVTADVHPRIPREADGHRVVHPSLADLPVVDVEGHVAAGGGLGRVGGELHPHAHLTGGQALLGHLLGR